MPDIIQCKICNSQSPLYFKTQVLHKYDVSYYKCKKCNFIQTEEPYWLADAYSSAITSLDLGLIKRNIENAPNVETIIKLFFDKNKKFVDYGGGYGMFVRIMRDKGFSFYRQDIYCENIFAKNYDVQDCLTSEKFELLTAFEVFEHLVNPLEEITKMLKLSDNILFTTCIYPNNTDLKNWWYLIPETGQHVSLYSKKSLETIASTFGLNYYGFNDSHHLLTKKKLSTSLYNMAYNKHFQSIFQLLNSNPTSLLSADFNAISSVTI